MLSFNNSPFNMLYTYIYILYIYKFPFNFQLSTKLTMQCVPTLYGSCCFSLPATLIPATHGLHGLLLRGRVCQVSPAKAVSAKKGPAQLTKWVTTWSHWVPPPPVLCNEEICRTLHVPQMPQSVDYSDSLFHLWKQTSTSPSKLSSKESRLKLPSSVLNCTLMFCLAATNHHSRKCYPKPF